MVSYGNVTTFDSHVAISLSVNIQIRYGIINASISQN